MKKKTFRYISFVLTLAVLFVSLPKVFAAAAPRYENSGREFMDNTSDGNSLYAQEKDKLPKKPDGSVPPQSITKQGTTLYINYRLWKDQGILGYGSYKHVVQNPQKDFHTGTQPPGQPYRTGANDGYYPPIPENPGKRGEWRFHGWDVSGNRLSNIFFKPDSVITKFDERNWIKNPWVNLPINKRVDASMYNDAAIGSEYDTTVKSGVQEWINKAMSIYGGVPLIGDIVDPEVYRYLNVESAPTTQRIGQGRMWHKRPDDSIWYQTVVVPMQGQKKNLPVTVAIEPITVMPEIKDLGTAIDSTKVTLKFKVTAALNDTGVFNESVKSTVYYTRDDISNWTINFTGPGQQVMTESNIARENNTGSFTFSYSTTYGIFRSYNWKLNFTASAAPNHTDRTKGNTGYAAREYGVGVNNPVEPPLRVVEMFTPNPNIPDIAFDGVAFTAADNTDMSKVETRKVYVDGAEVNGAAFFSGSYIFPGTVGENGRFAYVDCEYQVKGIPGDAGKLITRDVVYIYPTKPIANFKITSNTWRQNRLISVQNTSNAGNIQLVVQNYPIVSYEWTYGGDATQLRKGTDTDLSKELLHKAPGIYFLTLRCRNTLGKWSDPYTVTYQVLEDVAPAVGVNLAESVYTRNDKVSAWYYSAVSTDGDVIKSSNIDLWYDSNNDGTLDQRLNTWSNQAQFPDYTPTKLGYYKYILSAKEDITSDTLLQHITEADKKSASYEVEFWVDNYRPLSDLYINIPVQRANIDLYFMLDKNMDTAKKDYILNNRINMANWLLGKNIIPNVNIWDMRTYTYTQAASTSVNTGSSYPSPSVPYSSGGYSGTLQLSNISNNQYSQDQGYWSSGTESKTAYATGSGWGESYYTAGHWGGWVLTGSSSSDNPTISYSDGEGYSGTLYKTSYYVTGDSGEPSGLGTPGQTYTRYRTYSASYSGTVFRTATYWVSNIVWYDNYTGNYTGAIYKNVRQHYTDAFNPTAQKYIIYISDSTISELNDLNMVMGYAKTAKLFLAGTSVIKTQRQYDQYFDVTGKSIDIVADSMLQSIAENSPAVEKYYVLPNQQFVMNVGQLDLEGDIIIETGMQYVHEPGFFDNPTGVEPGTVAAFNGVTGWNSTVKSAFANTGKYTIYRRVKDRPSTDPNFAVYSYYSGNTSLEVYVVRKPIALATLDWDYDAAGSIYKTRWVDQSYDPDHQYSRPDKGIVGRNIMWRRPGGQWNYGIPDNLAPGTYELNYYVLDPEGYWSDPFVMNFTLNPSPSVQFNAALRTLDSKFSLSGVPASENLEAYNLWTRFPYNVSLEMALYNGAARVSPITIVNFGKLTGSRTDNDINWNNVIHQIPATLPDRSYDFRISAIGDYGQTAIKSFLVNISTPLNLIPSMPGEVIGGTAAAAGAQTSKYASAVNATLFRGTAYERTYSLTGAAGSAGSADKVWEGSLSIPGNIPDGNYSARFTAVAPNGSSQDRDVPFRLVNLSIANVSLSGYWNHWRGQVDILGERLSNEPHRFLSLERVKIDISTLGNPERVTIRFSPELEAMSYTDPNGHTYGYKEDYFGYKVTFPTDATFPATGNKVYWEYHLPLAPSSKGWNNNRLRQPYRMTVTAYKGQTAAQYVINDIDITGNIYDLTYFQPKK